MSWTTTPGHRPIAVLEIDEPGDTLVDGPQKCTCGKPLYDCEHIAALDID